MSFKSIAIAGASGQVGHLAVQEFLKQNWSVVALVSKASFEKKETTDQLKGAKIAVVDYSDSKSLQDAVTGVDVVLSTLGGEKMEVNQVALLAAAKAAKVKRFVPSEFGVDNEAMADSKQKFFSSLVLPKVNFRKLLVESGLEWTAVENNCFVGFFFSTFFGFDFANGKVTIPLDGKLPVAVIYPETIARLLPHILNHEKSKNTTVQIADGSVTWLDAIDYYEKASGKKLERTFITQSDVEQKIANDKSGNPAATLGDKVLLHFISKGTGTWKATFNQTYLPKVEVTSPYKYLDSFLVKKLSGKVAVVLGATGVVGSGATYNYLSEGATVIAVGRDKAKLAELGKKLGDLSKNLVQVVFSAYGDEKAPTLLREAVTKALPKDTKVDHVVTTLGFALTTDIPSKSGVKDLKLAFEDGLYPNVVAVQAFLPDLKEREGSTFSLVNGGLAHFSAPDYVKWWTASLKGAAVNALFNTVTAEVAKDSGKTRVSCFCIYYGVAYHGEKTNQWGLPGLDTYVLGGAFTAFAMSSAKGRMLDLQKEDAIKEQIASFAK